MDLISGLLMPITMNECMDLEKVFTFIFVRCKLALLVSQVYGITSQN